MKFKHLYESIIEEAQTKHDDLFLVLMMNLKLDILSSCKIWEQCGKRSKFRHITDGYGLVKLINNKDKKLSISATKLGKIWQGVETDGTVVAVIEADYEIWWPKDAWTYIGKDSMRWMDMNKAKNVTSNVDTSRRIDALNPIIPSKMIDEYYIALNNLLKKWDFFTYSLNDMDMRATKNYMLISTDQIPTKPNEKLVSEWVKEHKVISKKIVKEALELQVKFLDKYSKTIQKRLMQVYHDRQGRRRDRADEAVVNNVKVIEVVALDHDLLSSAISSMGALATQDELTPSTAKDILGDTILGQVLYNTNYKGLFTVYSYYDGFEFMDIIAKKQYGAQYGAGVQYLEDELKVKYFKNKYFKIG